MIAAARMFLRESDRLSKECECNLSTVMTARVDRSLAEWSSELCSSSELTIKDHQTARRSVHT